MRVRRTHSLGRSSSCPSPCSTPSNKLARSSRLDAPDSSGSSPRGTSRPSGSDGLAGSLVRPWSVSSRICGTNRSWQATPLLVGGQGSRVEDIADPGSSPEAGLASATKLANRSPANTGPIETSIRPMRLKAASPTSNSCCVLSAWELASYSSATSDNSARASARSLRHLASSRSRVIDGRRQSPSHRQAPHVPSVPLGLECSHVPCAPLPSAATRQRRLHPLPPGHCLGTPALPTDEAWPDCWAAPVKGGGWPAVRQRRCQRVRRSGVPSPRRSRRLRRLG